MSNQQIQRMPLSSTRLIIDGENIPFGAYQALYHKLTKKTERIFQGYRDAYSIDVSDLSDLHQRLCQGIKQYRVAGQHVEISHSLHEGQSRQFSSFEKFLISDCSTKCPSRSFIYELNFLIILPAEIPEAEDIPQRYKVTLNIDSQDFTDDDDDTPLFIRAMGRDDSVVMRLEYTDYAVATAIKSIIDAWVDGLNKKTKNKILTKISARRLSLSYNIFDTLKVIPLATGVFYILSNKDMNFIDLSTVILSSLTLFHFMSHVYNFFIQRIEEGATPLQPKTMLSITNGDKDRLTNKNNKRRSITNFALYTIGLLTSLTINLFSSAIYDAILQK